MAVPAVIGASSGAKAQSRLDLGGFLEVGGESERYYRVLQIAGVVPLTPWSIQPLSPTQAKELRATRPHPWSARLDSVDGAALAPGTHTLRPKGRVIENSAYPFQDGPGPTWAGRGFTGELQAGFSAAWQMVSAQIAPLAFVAQNSSFTLAPNGAAGAAAFGDARYPATIDAPQRFGTSNYSRLVPGTSFITLDTRYALVSASTAPNRWGPARDYPLVLGPNAGGFPSVYAGTSRPVDLWLFQVHARVIYGKLGQSSLSAPVDSERARFGTGAVGLIVPRGAPGLELGGVRFIHTPWPRDGFSIRLIQKPITSGLNLVGNTLNAVSENQVASLFARWAFPRAGVELYGEMYREDYPGHFHHALSLIEKPDDLAAFAIGFQRVLDVTAGRSRVVRGELVNGEPSHQERNERGFVIPIVPYVHSGMTQGHTSNGLLLGSPEAYGGAAWRVGYDEYTPNGRTTFSLERTTRFDWLPTLATTKPVRPDVILALRAEAMRFRGQQDYTVILIPSIDLNRNLVAENDVFNLTAAVTVRGWP
ncbi:MAG: hypothetical protein ACREBE_02060 [bacterium]